MGEARKATLGIELVTLGGPAADVAKSLYHFLAQTVDGRALQLIHFVPRGNGLEAWRVLCREFAAEHTGPETVAVDHPFPLPSDVGGQPRPGI